MIRQPICVVMGHVDHGKTHLLDCIRKTAMVAKEAGGITQTIGASVIPAETLQKICGPLLTAAKFTMKIPGLLFIDTPGHAAFTSLRKRGGNLADIAILVVDINEGIKPQTVEAIEILRQSKTPFVVAANKIDLVRGWKKQDDFILQNISKQAPDVISALETKHYELVGKLSEMHFNAERFDRVEDYTKQIAMIPVCAKSGEGIPELLMVIMGLAQRYLESVLGVHIEGAAKGSILEVKDIKGQGKCMDVILYDGTLKQGDMIVIGSIEGYPHVTKVRGLFEPDELGEMRDAKTKFQSVKQVSAACGVRIVAPEIDNVIAGMPLFSATQDLLEQVKSEVTTEVEEVAFETDKEGIVVKADTLGTLDALVKMLRDKGIKINKAALGNISKKDIHEAECSREKNPLDCVILGFQVKLEAEPTNLKVIIGDVIFHLVEQFEAWQAQERVKLQAKELEKVTRPCKFQILAGHTFRQSNPAVVGVEVMQGTLKTGMAVMKQEGRIITSVKSIQSEKENLTTVERGKQVAVSFEGVMVGRQINEQDILYAAINEEEYQRLKELKKYLSPAECEVLKEVAEIMRKTNPVWGV
ncbi:translation initiation factor IF-2 [Candidatus Woesearchaeota archaeon]|nr:translation initiation factor IF-2 [Candidatus Woesearchaeota archaeon]